MQEDDLPMSPDQPTLWIYLAVAAALVLLGGAFAGLTIALMGQDEIYLQVIRDSGEGREKVHAARVLRLLKKGKHWVLVTLLLSNVVTNETLPIVLDRSLGGGWPAVLGSTVLIVIFGEVIPQSICVRYGLPIGAWMATPVLILMYAMAPVAWPTAKLLDYLLGEDHGQTYKKAGLKTLVTLHRTLGVEQLSSDEVTIITAVLDLKEKPIGNIMTPMRDVFTLPSDAVLDEETMDKILSAGYSRIPVHTPGNNHNFIGMLLVKMLITYDPEDAKPVSEFALATLPETYEETSCLDIVNFFQEGKSHMVLVSENPGADSGALGVVTLEDVIEELIGEEIIDESDVFVDVHKAIRRGAPAPHYRIRKYEDRPKVQDEAPETVLEQASGVSPDEPRDIKPRNDRVASISENGGARLSTSPRATFSMRRTSSSMGMQTIKGSIDDPEIREHLKHLGPSNLASRPRTTRYNTVKIKPGTGAAIIVPKPDGEPQLHPLAHQESAPSSGIGAGVLENAGLDAKDAVQAIQAGYGTMEGRPGSARSHAKSIDPDLSPKASPRASRLKVDENETDGSSIGSLPSRRSISGPKSKRHSARSGSITENIIEAGGYRKVVLEQTSSSEEGHHTSDHGEPEPSHQDGGGENKPKGGRKKRRRKPKKRQQAAAAEETPLLGNQD